MTDKDNRKPGKGIQEIKEFMQMQAQGQQASDNKLDEIINLITIKGNEQRMANLSKGDLKQIYAVLVMNKLFFDNRKEIYELASQRLNLSVSQNGLLLKQIENMTKAEFLAPDPGREREEELR